MKKIGLSCLLVSLLLGQAQAEELILSLNLAKQSGEYHNPYTAAWIENDSGQSVRTLLLWREQAKWLKDLRTWWRKVGRRHPEIVDGVTSATRPAGNYKLRFAAENDQGVPLTAGDYTLKVEVVRENGGRAMLTQAFQLNHNSHHFVLPTTAETAQSYFTIQE